jgi:hypothetical protein
MAPLASPEPRASLSPAEGTPPAGTDPFDAGLVSVLAELREAAGPSLVAVLFFGSRLTGASPGKASAYDLLVVVEGYLPFYRRVHGALRGRRSPRTLARLNRWLPPNVLRAGGTEPATAGAKLFVISERDLSRSVIEGRDHFCRGRLMHRIEIVHARDAAARTRAEALVETNRRETLLWAAPFLSGAFTAESFARSLLGISYRGEIRPETPDRVREVFDAQRGFFVTTYERVLREGVATGLLAREGDAYRFVRPPGSLDRIRARLYFLRSKIRATLRWTKYVATFEGWLDYIVAKAERRTGIAIEISERERRHPFLFLWPKLFRVLRARERASSR